MAGLRALLTGKGRKKKNNDINHISSSKRQGSQPSSLVTIAESAAVLPSHCPELETVFKKFDVNGDGKISCSELGCILASLGHPCTKEELQCMMSEADADGDGFIDFSEFVEINTKGVDGDAEMEDLRSAFLVFDVDRNGAITAEELYKVLRSLGEWTSMEECSDMIKGVDSDGDGQVNFEEFKIMMTKSR